MLPSLSPLSDASALSTELSPPPRFRPLRGVLHNPSYVLAPARPSKGSTAAQRAGLRYESQVHAFLERELPTYFAGPQLWVEDDSGRRSLIPDGLFLHRNIPKGLGGCDTSGVLTLIEVKYSHMPEAWWQLRRLYEPVLRLLFQPPFWHINCVEICRSFDPAVQFPEPVFPIEDLKTWVGSPHTSFGVLKWRT